LGKRNINIWYTTVLDRLPFIKVDLPSIDNEFPYQIFSFFSNFLQFCPINDM
jgi:hypothetical protein